MGGAAGGGVGAGPVIPMVMAFQRFAVMSSLPVNMSSAQRSAGSTLQWINMRVGWTTTTTTTGDVNATAMSDDGRAVGRRLLQKRAKIAKTNIQTASSGSTEWGNFVDTVIASALLLGGIFTIHAAILLNWETLTIKWQAWRRRRRRQQRENSSEAHEGERKKTEEQQEEGEEEVVEEEEEGTSPSPLPLPSFLVFPKIELAALLVCYTGLVQSSAAVIATGDTEQVVAAMAVLSIPLTFIACVAYVHWNVYVTVMPKVFRRKQSISTPRNNTNVKGKKKVEFDEEESDLHEHDDVVVVDHAPPGAKEERGGGEKDDGMADRVM